MPWSRTIQQFSYYIAYILTSCLYNIIRMTDVLSLVHNTYRSPQRCRAARQFAGCCVLPHKRFAAQQPLLQIIYSAGCLCLVSESQLINYQFTRRVAHLSGAARQTAGCRALPSQRFAAPQPLFTSFYSARCLNCLALDAQLINYTYWRLCSIYSWHAMDTETFWLLQSSSGRSPMLSNSKHLPDELDHQISH